MAGITLTEEQLNTVLVIAKDLQERIPCNGMPELDQDLAEMIEILEGASGAGALTIDGLNPAELEVPGPDYQVVVHGTGYTAESIINWNGGDEVTEFVSDIKLRTLVKPSTVQAPLPFELPVYVRNGEVQSNVAIFTFTAAAEQEATLKELKAEQRERRK